MSCAATTADKQHDNEPPTSSLHALAINPSESPPQAAHKPRIRTRPSLEDAHSDTRVHVDHINRRTRLRKSLWHGKGETRMHSIEWLQRCIGNFGVITRAAVGTDHVRISFPGRKCSRRTINAKRFRENAPAVAAALADYVNAETNFAERTGSKERVLDTFKRLVTLLDQSPDKHLRLRNVDNAASDSFRVTSICGGRVSNPGLRGWLTRMLRTQSATLPATYVPAGVFGPYSDCIDKSIKDYKRRELECGDRADETSFCELVGLAQTAYSLCDKAQLWLDYLTRLENSSVGTMRNNIAASRHRIFDSELKATEKIRGWFLDFLSSLAPVRAVAGVTDSDGFDDGSVDVVLIAQSQSGPEKVLIPFTSRRYGPHVRRLAEAVCTYLRVELLFFEGNADIPEVKSVLADVVKAFASSALGREIKQESEVSEADSVVACALVTLDESLDEPPQSPDSPGELFIATEQLDHESPTPSENCSFHIASPSPEHAASPEIDVCSISPLPDSSVGPSAPFFSLSHHASTSYEADSTAEFTASSANSLLKRMLSGPAVLGSQRSPSISREVWPSPPRKRLASHELAEEDTFGAEERFVYDQYGAMDLRIHSREQM